MKLAAIFTDGMILQQKQKNRVWGDEDAGEVSVEFLGKKYSSAVEGDRWYVDIDPADAGGPYEMRVIFSKNPDDPKNSSNNSAINNDELAAKKYTVKKNPDGTEVITIKDILVGEVWFAGGQSNMELELQNSEKGMDVVRAADYDRIRFYNTPKCPAVDDELFEREAKTKWRYVRGEECREMSAVAYYFAVEMYKKLGVPIGILDCYWGGTSATCWVPEEMISDIKEKEVTDYIDDWKDLIAKKPEEVYDEELAEYNIELNKWNSIVEDLKKEDPEVGMDVINEKAGEFPWPPPRGGKSPYRPFGLYDSMVSRVAPYGVRGFLYYQGEEDQDRAVAYEKLNRAVIDRWRADFDIGDGTEIKPFFITQLPMFIGKDDVDEKKFTAIREQQTRVSLNSPNTGMAVIIDCGEFDNIHPIDKATPGHRLALQVLGRVYGVIDRYENMQAEKITFDDDMAVIVCAHTYGEIRVRPSENGELTAKLTDREIPADTVSDTKIYDNDHANIAVADDTAASNDTAYTIRGFEVSADGITYHPAAATVDGDTIRVRSAVVTSPKSVRYAWFDYGVANVYNGASLPLAPFLCDKE